MVDMVGMTSRLCEEILRKSKGGREENGRKTEEKRKEGKRNAG